jgi:hypothetical protein
LASLYYHIGNFALAERLYKQALGNYKKTLGKNTLLMQASLAIWHFSMKAWATMPLPNLYLNNQ